MQHRHETASGIPEILIVEDSPTQAESLRALLVRHGYHVRVADDGRQALEAIRRHPPALVLSDILMPEMDGYALCSAIKQDAATAAIPVVLVTSLTDASDIVRGLEAGADNFIRKPYAREYLLQRIHDILDSRRRRSEQRALEGAPLDAVPGERERMSLFLGGQRYLLHAHPQQMLDLLVSTYEQAVTVNAELQARERQVNELNARLARHTARLEAQTRDEATHSAGTGSTAPAQAQDVERMRQQMHAALRAIIDASNALESGALGTLESRQRQAADAILNCARALQAQIGDLLDLSHAEAGEAALNLEAVDLQQLLQGALKPFRQQALAQGIHLRLELEALGPVQVDRDKTRQILDKLLAHAASVTPPGAVLTLRACRMEAPEPPNRFPAGGPVKPGPYLALSVMDGVFHDSTAVQHQSTSPSKPETSEAARNRLAILQRLAQLHGGAVSIGKAGRNSTLTVWLPYLNGESAGLQPASLPAFGTQ
ncbi:MAG TPA: hybrid sensor histidine kinase/response regulator [Noviherbaspirillum sp.]